MLAYTTFDYSSGMSASELKRMKEVEAELAQYKKMYAELARENYALKDLIDIEGRVTTGGSRHWAERVSPVTATIARRLMAAGMIIIGKTHTVEFAMGGWGTNRQLGTPWKPGDMQQHRAPGGSSAGSGVGPSTPILSA